VYEWLDYQYQYPAKQTSSFFWHGETLIIYPTIGTEGGRIVPSGRRRRRRLPINDIRATALSSIVTLI